MMYPEDTNVINPFSGEAIDNILYSLGSYISSIIPISKIATEIKIDTEMINLAFLNSIPDDELELYMNAEFWKAYKEAKQGKVKSGTLKDFKKAIGL